MKLRTYSKFKIFILISLILIIIIYLIIYNNTDFRYILIDEINNKLLFTNKNNIYESILTPNLIINGEKDNKEIISTTPLVYIYNTHQTEGYDYKKLDHSVKPTVLYASYILKEYLGDLGIASIVESASIKEYLTKHNLDYTGSYDASRYYAKNKLSSNKEIIYLIDLHRDSASYKNTLYEKDNKKYARIMFVISTKHRNYEKNLTFAKSLNNKLEERYKGISRGIYERKDVIFNQDLSDKAILIELGGVDNTLEEINNTLEIIAKLIYEDINNEEEKK